MKIIVIYILAVALTASAQVQKLQIKVVEPAKWQASERDVSKVLYSSANQLWQDFPGRRMPLIKVEAQGGPIVLHKRGSDGEISVKLSTGKTYWAQYAYQFAHEFCHICCNYDQESNPNKWFEESLCETASLYALRSMSKEWKKNPPYPNWRDYSKSLYRYAEDRINKAPLPAGESLASWYRANEKLLRSNACDRPKNAIIAGELLKLFETAPANWEAVAFINSGKSYKNQPFKEYLQDWKYHAPEKHHPFIDKIAQLFEIELK